MPYIERSNSTKKKPMPAGILVMVLVLAVFGLITRSCWFKQVEETIIVTKVRPGEQNRASVEVLFNVQNKSTIDRQQSFWVKLYSADTKELVADKIFSETIPGSSNREYLKIIEKFKRPLKENEKIGWVTIELYHPKLF